MLRSGARCHYLYFWNQRACFHSKLSFFIDLAFSKGTKAKEANDSTLTAVNYGRHPPAKDWAILYLPYEMTAEGREAIFGSTRAQRVLQASLSRRRGRVVTAWTYGHVVRQAIEPSDSDYRASGPTHKGAGSRSSCSSCDIVSLVSTKVMSADLDTVQSSWRGESRSGHGPKQEKKRSIVEETGSSVCRLLQRVSVEIKATNQRDASHSRV